MSAESALQAGVLAHLADAPGVLTHLGDPPRLFDRPPGGAAFPFLALGRGESRPLDGDDTALSEHRLTLHVWTRRQAYGELKAITGAVSAALHNADIALSGGYRLVLCQIVYLDHFEGADTRSVHGLVRLRALVQQL